MSRNFRSRLHLHDCLSLGEVERGLTSVPATWTVLPEGCGDVDGPHGEDPRKQQGSSTPNHSISSVHVDPEEIRQRLPLLLRLLQDSRPLSSIPDVFGGGSKVRAADAQPPPGVAEEELQTVERDVTATTEGASEPSSDVGAQASSTKGGDPVVQRSVDRLEDRVAMDPTAEDVERVACRLAPMACRRLLHRKKLSRGRTTTLHSLSSYDIERMLSGAKRANSTTKRPKLAASAAPKPSPNQQDEEEDEDAFDDDSGLSDAGDLAQVVPEDEPATEDNKKRRRVSSTAATPSRASLIQLARGEDSPEATVARTLEELVRLVRAYSTPPPTASVGRVATANAEEDGSSRMWLDDALDDSILAQEGRSHRHAAASGGGSDLPSTIASLLHHAPLIQAKDVAEAACRAALPQAAAIVSRIGANAPPCVSGLVSGCLRALLPQGPVVAGIGNSTSFPPRRRRDATRNAVEKSLREVAKLSPRESSRVRSVLAAAYINKVYVRSDRAMLLGLRLELLNVATATDAADSDDLAAAALEVACLVNEHYAASHTPNNGNGQLRDNDNNDDQADADQQADENQDDADDDDAGKADGSSRAGQRQGEDGAGASPAESESSDRHLPSRGQRGYSLLHGVLSEDHKLARETLDVLRIDLSRQRIGDDARMPTAQFSIVASAVTWMLLSVPLSNAGDETGTDSGLEALVRELQEWVTRIRSLPDSGSRETMASRGIERAFCLLVCSSFAGLCAALRIGDQSTRILDNQCDACCSMLSDLLLTLPQTIRNPGMAGFAARFLMRAGRHDVESLIVGSLLRIETTLDRVSEPNEIVTRACQRLFSGFNSEQQETICLDRPCRAAAPIDLLYGLDLAGDVSLPETKRSVRLREILERLLVRGAAVDQIQNPITPSFIESSVCYFSHRRGESSLPIIHPVTLERLSIPLRFDRTRSLSDEEKHFILCLYYWFAYRYFAKNDTFSVDFRSLPVVTVRHICKNFGLSASLGSRLCCWIDHFCPEAHKKKAYSYHSYDESNRITKPQLLRIIRSSIETPQLDQSGVVAEKAFIVARGCLPESTLVTTTVSAFFSEPNNLPPFFTYASLYRDPLVLLKCAIEVWKSRGLRRIILSLLESLLRTNDQVLQEATPNEELKLELRDARNLLLTRSLVTLTTAEFEQSRGSQRILPCSLTQFFIRRTIARNPGTFAALLKQGLPDGSVDWMIDWVPECVVDSTRICVVMSQRSSLGAPERLAIADGAFRLAIMQGGFGSDDTSRQLVVAALSQLVSSFFLVLGPVGVPVAAILGSGHDATMISRNAAFRILNAMRRVQTYRSEVRNECIVAVQKLVGLCKGENILAGLPGAVASRQKKLLKELIEALSRANNAMGNAQVTSIGQQI